MIQRRTLVKAVIAALAPLSMTSAFAAGGPSGAHIGYQHQGQLGAVDMNPYKIAPLTAIIRDRRLHDPKYSRAHCSQSQRSRNRLQGH